MIALCGFSLTELLISLFLSSVLMLCLMTEYSSLKAHYYKYEAAIERSLDTQLIVDFIRERVHEAGFTPCLNIERLISVDTRTQLHQLRALTVTSELRGFQVNHMKKYYCEVVLPWNPNDLRIKDTEPLDISRPVLIADCYHAEVHTLQKVTQKDNVQVIQLQVPLVYAYQSPVYIGEWQEERFFIRNKSTLFYQLVHVDALSHLIRDLSSSILNRHGRRLLQVDLQLDDGILHLDTEVRSI